MSVYFITFRSVTLAQRGENILMAGGIHSNLQRTPRWMEERGCGYCLRLRYGEIGRCAALLRQARVDFRKIYRQVGTGNVEEVVL